MFEEFVRGNVFKEVKEKIKIKVKTAECKRLWQLWERALK